MTKFMGDVEAYKVCVQTRHISLSIHLINYI